MQLNPARRTLIFCAHQWALPRVFEALSDMRHLVPKQIGLLGLNNAEWAGLTTPSISTIVEPVEKEGRIACSMLIDLMRDPNAPPAAEGVAMHHALARLDARAAGGPGDGTRRPR